MYENCRELFSWICKEHIINIRRCGQNANDKTTDVLLGILVCINLLNISMHSIQILRKLYLVYKTVIVRSMLIEKYDRVL